MKSVLILIIIIFIVAQFPVAIAEQYGTIHGRALDKNGNGIAGVSLKLQNGDYKTIDSTTTGPDGSYSFGSVPTPNGNDVFRIQYSFVDADGRTWGSLTDFFNVMSMRITTQDLVYDNYPSSGIGNLYGVVTSNQNMVLPMPATVYLDNGMFMTYAGDRYDTWTFEQLPVGKYVVWAEANIGNVTYASERQNVTVRDEPGSGYVLIYLPTNIAGTNKVAYHSQPEQMKNVVRGTVSQKSGIPIAGTKVDLYRLNDNSKEYVASTTSNQAGQYLFDNVNVATISQKFIVCVSVEGYSATQDSDLFTVYYANTLGVQHDINVPVRVDFLSSGSITIQSVPSGAAISIDGVDMRQTTPYTMAGLLTGSHDIGLSLDGYFNDSFAVQVLEDSEATINRTLKVSTGSTYLNVMPGGALVYIDGEYAGTSPVSLAKYPAGQHSYLVACDGYRNESGTFEIVPGEAITEEIDMVATPGFSLAYIGYLIGSFIHQIFSLF